MSGLSVHEQHIHDYNCNFIVLLTAKLKHFACLRLKTLKMPVWQKKGLNTRLDFQPHIRPKSHNNKGNHLNDNWASPSTDEVHTMRLKASETSDLDLVVRLFWLFFVFFFLKTSNKRWYLDLISFSLNLWRELRVKTERRWRPPVANRVNNQKQWHHTSHVI